MAVTLAVPFFIFALSAIVNFHFFEGDIQMAKSGVSKVVFFLKIFLFLLLFAGVAFIGIYPMKNQGVTLRIYSDDRMVSKSMSVSELAALSEFSVDFPGVVQEKIREIRITRYFKTVAVDKILNASFSHFARIEGDKILFNSNACELLRSNSRSALMERLFFAEVLLAITLLLLIIVEAVGEKLEPGAHDNHGPVFEMKKFFSQVSSYSYYMIYAANSDLKAEVANSYLNKMWWLLEPFFSMLVYVVVFGRLMGNSIKGYAVFVFAALLMWNYFSRCVSYSVQCIRANRTIVTSVYVPKHVLLLTNMIISFFKLIFSLIVLIPLLFIFHVHIGLGALWILPAYILMILLSFGIGMILMHYGVYIDDLGYAVGILLQMLMFLSGVFYDVVTSLPKPLNTLMLCLNPLSMFIDSMRNALLQNIVCNVPLVVLWTLISVLLCYMGIHIVFKNENSYVKVV